MIEITSSFDAVRGLIISSVKNQYGGWELKFIADAMDGGFEEYRLWIFELSGNWLVL